MLASDGDCVPRQLSAKAIIELAPRDRSNSRTCWGSLSIPDANPMNANAPETSHKDMPALFRSTDIHHAANAIIAELASATELIEGSTRGTRQRSKKPISGTTMADKRTAEFICGHSAGSSRYDCTPASLSM